MYPRTFFKQIVISAFQNSIRFKQSCHGLKLPLNSLPSHKWIHISRTSSTTSGNAFCVKYESLPGRALVRLSGDGVHEYLQGLITNDINHLQNAPSLYTMFLNTKGRILFDSIIYKYNDILLVECDMQEIDSFVRHLKMYKVRRKIAIDNVTDVFSVGVVYNPKQNLTKNCDLNGTIKDLEQLVPCTTIYDHDSSFEQTVKDILIDKKKVFVYRDPRLSTLGVRLIHSKEVDIRSFIEQKHPNQPDEDNYVTIRYKLGVAEGIDEIPLGNSFPHEYNCDYLHGVSFHKGCYIGQELTARTQHTGVVRKRIMPLYFEETQTANSPEKDSILEDSDRLVKVNIGKLRGVHDKYGVALLRIAEALKVSKLKVKNALATTTKPAWWPIEASKSITKATEVS